jgi:hypothetical protein
MRTKLPVLIFSAMMAASSLAVMGTASAQQVTVVGTITQISMAPDGKSAVAVLKDGKTGDAVSISISDDVTLEKFKDKRIVTGDEIRTRFDKKDGRNASKSFKKTAGC